MNNEEIRYSRNGRRIKHVGTGKLSEKETVEADRIESVEAKEHGAR